MLSGIRLSQLVAGVLGGAALGGAQLAKAVAIASVTITGGTFSYSTPIDEAFCGSASSSSFVGCREVTVGANNVLVAGQTGEPIVSSSSIPEADRTVSFMFFGRLWTQRLAASADFVGARDWDNGFSGEIEGNTLTLNMGGWFGNWGGTNLFGGTDSSGDEGRTSTAATGTIDDQGNFQVDWFTYQRGGPTDNQTFYWRLTGVAQPVPEPETWAMLLAGLGLIGAAACRADEPKA